MTQFTKAIRALVGIATLVIFSVSTSSAQRTNFRLGTAKIVGYNKYNNLPNFIKFSADQNIKDGNVNEWMSYAFNLPNSITFKAYNVERDQLGFTHTHYKEYFNNLPVEGSMLITHSKNGRLEMINGDYFLNFNSNTSASISSQAALEFALKKVNATKYKWENREEELAMRKMLNNPNFTYFPKSELVVVHKTGADYSAANMRLAYKINIYAEDPLSNSNVFVDANTGEIISEEQLIHTGDAVGTAVTKYSGTVTMTSDSFGTSQYRLQEADRGLGIQTYNVKTASTYTNTDFTNTSSAWNVSGNDQCAEDAHWGAEMTYDYYYQVHNRNSIDNAGLALLSYVHYMVNYENAFWDGTRMTYGDGNISDGYNIFTALDICGHEITHGLTSHTAGLSGGGKAEPDALNEGFSDIFGTTIEAFARPSQHDWLMGADIMTSHAGLRDMSNPKNLGQPDCYMGANWDPAGEPHNNNGPCIYWYYLLCQGGSATNDNNDAYTVNAITMNEAQFIAFRGLTVYFTPSTTYSDARMYTIQAANDLYGACSPESITTTNAWYAVGVGPVFSSVIAADFSANVLTSCILPLKVNFTNMSTNGNNSNWSFGDGDTSTAYNPTHTYTTAGTFDVKLSVNSACGADSMVKTSYIILNPPSAPVTTSAYSCTPKSLTLGASGGGTLTWYNSSTGGSVVNTGTSYTTPSLSSSVTYYVTSLDSGAKGNVGPATIGTGSLHNNTSVQYLIFDVLQACTIQTVLVNSGATGSRNVLLWDSAGNQLQSIPITFSSGTQTITLNIHLNPGVGYRLGGTSMNLWRQSSGTSFPYSLAGSINITGSSAADHYYYYYNWQVVNDPCVSARIPVTASIGASLTSFGAVSSDTICISAVPIALTNGVPAGGTYSGDGVSGSSFDPSAAGVGVHPITYMYTDPNNCTTSATNNIVVSSCIQGINSISNQASSLVLYPNPTNGNFTVEVGLTQNEKAELKIMNVMGQVILTNNYDLTSGNNKLQLNLPNVAKGLYVVQVRTSSNVFTKTVELN